MNAIGHEPVATGAEQPWGLSASEIVTVPVGVPDPGGLAVTVNTMVTVTPAALESGLSEMIAVVVAAWLTTWLSVDEVLVANSVSPL